MTVAPSICLACRLRLLSRLHQAPSSRTLYLVPQSRPWRGLATTSRRFQHNEDQGQVVDKADTQVHIPKRWSQHRLQAHTDQDTTPNDLEDAVFAPEPPSETSDLLPEDAFQTILERQQSSLPQIQPSPETVARAAREAFGDRLPDGALNEEQYKIYERLYGTPLKVSAEELAEEEDEDLRDVLYREGEDGELEELVVLEPNTETSDKSALDGGASMEENSETLSDGQSHTTDELQELVAANLRDQAVSDIELTVRSPDDLVPYEEEHALDQDEEDLELESSANERSHPLTTASRSGTIPRTLPLPQSNFTGPISLLLSNIANKHLDEAANRIFEGPGLPYSPSTPSSSRTKPQKPIPLNATHGKMSEIEADIYMAAVMPQTYAAVMSTLVETRKRLGASWLEGLLTRKGGPRILDAGAAGAGVIAWREVLRAEWKRMHNVQEADPSQTTSTSDQQPERTIPPVPFGKATVLTGSLPLRQRSSVLLNDTTFLPRLPDYIHAPSAPDASQRKQYDIIVAPHSLWHMHENHERHQKLQNLWSLLDPAGGVLIIIEKGVPRGFEVIADARSYLINQLFARPEGAPELIDPSVTPDADQDDVPEPEGADRSSALHNRRAPAHIIAPCPHAAKCPLYLVPGMSRQRKDYCRFQQRYIRPPYLQRILGAKGRNYDDVEFSYVAVQKGVSVDTPRVPPALNAEGQPIPNLQGAEADARAFEGYDIDDPDVAQPQSSPAGLPHVPNPLPRVLLAPLKRKGHVLLDMCAPSGAFERWTVTRSYGRQAYRDARKARWGDLWALGAKGRERRRVRLGVAAMARGVGTGRGAEAMKGKDPRAAGPVKDVKGRTVAREEKAFKANRAERKEGGQDLGEDESESRDEKVRRKLLAKDRGRDKARRRRREETKTLYGGGRGDV